jgi:TonB family protein
MIDWIYKHMDSDDRFGWSITGGMHLILLIFAIIYTINFDIENRPAYMEVTLGEFRSGTAAQQAEQQQEEVATRPNPAEEEPDDPNPEITQPTETPQQPEEEATKPVDLTDQTEEVIDEDVIETPETDIIDPDTPDDTEEVEETEVPPKTEEDEQILEGVTESGDERGLEGDVNVDQGTGTTPDRSAPYDLKWEGELDRSPMVQPLPANSTNIEAVITVRFEVNPDGSLGSVFPLRKMNPELEREVMRTLRSWRFSRLPSGVPQEPQWGTITFRFVLD